jgi:uncharacterized protein
MDFQFPVKPPAFNVMLKPTGPLCNLNCTYCYYLEKKNLFPSSPGRLDDVLLEKFTQEYIEAQDVPVVLFVWQGGEPLLLGLDFFKKAVQLQQKYAAGKKIENSLQTNGTLLTDEICIFLRENNFLTGISIDGPRHLHDHYRVDKKGSPTWDKVMKGISLLQKHKVEFNTLSVVNNITSQKPLEVYRFLKQIGSTFMQFIPIVERVAENSEELPLSLVHHKHQGTAQITEWSVNPKQYGTFLNTIFDEWVRNDVGRYFVQMFDVTLANWYGANPGLCVFSEKCGTAAVMEHNGNIYCCDHYVYEDYLLGNISQTPLSSLMASSKQSMFGQDKKSALPAECIACAYRFACHGDCPKHRIIKSVSQDRNISYLCQSYKMFFEHSKPFMQYMVNELKAERPPSNVMQWIRNRDASRTPAQTNIGRNEPCPCNSGKKYKQCHGK